MRYSRRSWRWDWEPHIVVVGSDPRRRDSRRVDFRGVDCIDLDVVGLAVEVVGLDAILLMNRPDCPDCTLDFPAGCILDFPDCHIPDWVYSSRRQEHQTVHQRSFPQFHHHVYRVSHCHKIHCHAIQSVFPKERTRVRRREDRRLDRGN